MKNSSAPNVRLVRCPKCKEVLPEPADVPFYRCGGCDTILQAKHYKKANVAEDHVHGGEASSSNPPPFMDRNEGLNQSSAQNGNLEQQPGVSNSSREASISSQPKQQLPSSSSSQHFPDRDEEADQVLEVTNTLREDSSLNESSPPSHKEPSNSDPQIDEVEEDSGASSSDESKEQLPVPQIVLEGREVRQGVIVAEDQLEAADSSCGAASPEASADKTDSEAYVPNLNASMNCRLEQPRVSCFPAEALLSDEPSLHETNSSPRVPAEEGHVDSTEVKEHLEVSDFRSEPTLSDEPTVGEDKLSSQLGTPNEDVMTAEPHLAVNNWERRPESGVECEEEASSTDESVSILKRNESFQSIRANQEEEADNVVDICGMDENVYPRTVTSSNQSRPLENNELSQLVTENQELHDEGTVQNELGICNEDHVVDYLSDEIISPAGEDVDHHAEEHSTPIMLNEIRIPEVLSDVSSRRRNRRPRTQEFPPRVPLYERSQERRYESSDLVDNDFYDHPSYCAPHRYRDVESRVTRRHHQRSDVDGRMISEAFWMGEELHMHPYPDPSSDIYPHPRHQMYYHERREAEYQPLVHSMARVPYSGDRLRSGYRVLDSYSYHLYPGERRWSSHLPPPGLSYSRGRYGPREPFDSYNASPQVVTDSDYYARSHDTISEDQRRTDQRMSRLRRRSQPVQHIQPIGGAAPFITCYLCSELLQLPSDFVLFKGVRIHRVKCSACSKILRFTLKKGRHLVPDVPQPISPPRREYADKFLKSASTLQGNHDNEALHRRSASTSNYGGISERVSLRSSSEAPVRQRSKAESNHSQDKGKCIMGEMHRPAKVTWKVEDRSSSPLHRLMGYSSPSAVLNAYGSSDDLEIQE